MSDPHSADTPTSKLGENSQKRIEKALKLEELQRNKAIMRFNGECDAEISGVVSDHAARGVLQSGATVRAIIKAHVARAEKIIGYAMELRKAAIERVPELATEPHFAALLDHLERTADAICSTIPTQIAQRLGGTGALAPATTDVVDREIADDCMKLKAHARREVEIMKREMELRPVEAARETGVVTHSALRTAEQQPDPRRVFVVHGRNLKARDAMFTFLRSINLEPIEWSEAVSFTGEASPFTGQILDRALSQAKAVVVLITGDDLARLGTRFQSASDPQHEKDFTPQARPNVLFEAGMAFGRQPERTILTSLGPGKPFSDVAGRNEVRISNRPGDRQALAGRLKTAGCAVKTDHKADWLTAGDFDAAILTPDNGTGDTETARRAPLAAVPVEAQQDENERRGR